MGDYCNSSPLILMLNAMRHRGPDGTHIETLGQQGCFGHNRLAIIDLHDRAKQPIWDSSRRYCLSFNGEIYNFKSLRNELTSLGHRFQTQSDSEVLIQAWAQWRTHTINRLVGMFAFAIWDKSEGELYLVRDRMGEKPLYFAPLKQDFKNGILFASELKGLIQHPLIPKSLSLTALNHYLSFGYTPTEECIFDGIYKLPPAKYLKYNLNTLTLCTIEYWTLSKFFKQKLEIDFRTAKQQLAQLLSDTVKHELNSDVPLGAFLSGGIDSASIVHQIKKNTTQKIYTFTIGFKEKTFSELKESAQTARHLGVEHHASIISSKEISTLSKIICSFDEPFSDTSLIPTYHLCEFAKNHVTVSLSGDGGDELFGGYITYHADRYHRLAQLSPFRLRKLLYGLSRYFPTSLNKISLDYKIKQFLRGCLLEQNRAHLGWREIFTEEHKNLLCDDQFLGLQDPKESLLKWFCDVKKCHYLDQAMYVDIKTWLVDDILTKVDRASMAHSLEVRSPFLDHRIVEFAAKLPINYKIIGRKSKRILKAIHADSLPHQLLNRSKKGFNCPISHWLNHELYEQAYETTTSHHLTRWFKKSAIEKMWIEHRQGLCNNGYRLFNLLCLGIWCREYLKN